MKKCTILFLTMALSSMFVTQAAEINVAAGENLTAALRSAVDGDVITLTSAAVYPLDSIANLPSVTIQAAAGLSAKPLIKGTYTGSKAYYTQFYPKSGSTLTLDGLAFDGGTNQYFFILVQQELLANIIINNCDVKNNEGGFICTRKGVVQPISTQAKGGSLMVTNSTFKGNGRLLYTEATAGKTKVFVDVTFINCYVSVKGEALMGVGLTSDLRNDNLRVQHVTFNGCGAREFNISTDQSTTISDVILANNASGGTLILGQYGNFYDHCAVYNYSANISTGYVSPSKLIGGGSVNPTFDVNGIATAPELVNAGTDGKTVGYYDAGQLLPASTDGINPVSVSRYAIYQNGNELIAKGFAQSSTYQISTITGQTILTGTLDHTSIALQSLKKGIYFVKIGHISSKFVIR